MARLHNILKLAKGIVDTEDYDALDSLLEPSPEKDKFGNALEDVLGYNALTYHDRQFLISEFDDIVSKAPESMRPMLQKNADTIIDECLAGKQDIDPEYLRQILIARIYLDTGWMYSEGVTDMSSAIRDEIIGDDVVNDFDDEDLDDEEDADMEDDEDDDESPYYIGDPDLMYGDDDGSE